MINVTKEKVVQDELYWTSMCTSKSLKNDTDRVPHDPPKRCLSCGYKVTIPGLQRCTLCIWTQNEECCLVWLEEERLPLTWLVEEFQNSLREAQVPQVKWSRHHSIWVKLADDEETFVHGHVCGTRQGYRGPRLYPFEEWEAMQKMHVHRSMQGALQ